MTPEKQLFESIYNDTKQSVHRYIAAKCYDLADVDDIFQNVYLNVFEALRDRDREIENREAFVILIAKRELFRYYGIIKRLKALTRQDGVFESDELTDLDSLDIEDRLINKNLCEQINEVIAGQSLKTQKIFYFYYYRGLKISEIADTLGLSESTVKKKLYGTVARLRRLYGKEN